MALLTTINGIPLYSTVNEALAYAERSGLQGYHTHRYKNIVGYMGGTTHNRSTSYRNITLAQSTQSSRSIQPTQQTQPAAQPVQAPQPVQQPVQQPTYTPPTSTPSSSGGGGY